VPYVTPAQLSAYLPAATLALATLDQQAQACADATNRADSYMNARFTMPLLAWPSDITTHTASIAIYLLMHGPIGIAPQAGSDQNIDDKYYQAVGGGPNREPGYFPGVEAQRIHPAVTPSIAVGQDPGHDAPQVSSQPPRGWQMFRGGRPVVGGF